MRMLTLALLLASAATVPAHAAPGDRDRGEARNAGAQQVERERWGGRDSSGPAAPNEARAARFEAREARSQHQSEAQAQDRGRRGNWGGGQVQAQPQPAPVAQAQPSGNRGNGGGNRNWQGRRDTMTTGIPSTAPQQRNDAWRGRRNDANQNDRPNGVRGQAPVAQNGQRRWDGNRDNASRNDGNRNDGRRWDGDRNNRQNGAQSGGWQRQDNGRWERRDGRNHDGRNWNNGSQHRDWNRTWRNDRRYDWQHYRNQYRNHYRAPRYYNPYGYNYGYRRFGIGIYLDSLFFSNRYWLSDPWEYRLPAAPYGCRWVRYYDDVLLVDIESGYVVDVIHDFFW